MQAATARGRQIEAAYIIWHVGEFVATAGASQARPPLYRSAARRIRPRIAAQWDGGAAHAPPDHRQKADKISPDKESGPVRAASRGSNF